MRTGLREAWLSGLLLAGSGCEAPERSETPAPDYDAFERDVYPILLRDCGMLTCHGTPKRPFRLYGPGRLRADEAQDRFDPVTEDELWLSYQRTRSMLTHDGDVRTSPLLSKPLPGAGHRGVDRYGGAVYRSTTDADYLTLVAWARGELWYGER